MSSEIIINNKIIEIRRPRNPNEYKEIMKAQVEIWGMPDYSEAVTYHLLIAADRRGGLVLGAFEKDTGRVVGFVFGFPALTSDGKIYHYSHMAGVIPEYRYKGLGYLLKLNQRKYALEQGLNLIMWTYDPLQSLNARFNISKLGVIVRKFYEDYYGELSDNINIGMPTDRFNAEWWIKSKHVEMRLLNRRSDVSLEELFKLDARKVTKTKLVGGLHVLEDFNLNEKAKLILIEIPNDLDSLRKNSKNLKKWRFSMRKIFDHYINRENYIVVDFIIHSEKNVKRYFYILMKTDLESVLEGGLPWSV